ncbi:unnamed protein product [Phytomonas sp. EM1]|nr:unnamed protein product [Phytomonas sp. EM1]|eukprot:CCW65896.1 unnamed protein product [Phytomonas sp. isolate EM1]
MNATLQCLLHTPHLVERLEADVRRMRRTRRNGNDKETDRDGNGATKTDGEAEPCACAPATESLIGLARSDEEGGGSEGFLLRLKDIAAARNEQFSNGQNDAHEFLRTILHAVHEEINRRGRAPYAPIENIPEETAAAAMARWMAHLRGLDDSTVYDFFGGVLCSRCECLNCQNVSLTFDPFLDLSLPIALTPTTPSLRGKTPKSTKGGASGEKGSAFQFFSSNKAASREEKGSRCTAEAVDIVLRESCMADTYEMLNGGNQLFCDKCKKLCDGRRCSNVALWPRILVLHLKRFDGSGKKNDANIIYPKTFMLRDVRYRLYAVCCHSGSESSGHYTNYVALDEAVVKQSDSNIISDACGEETPSKAPCRSTMEKWYLCNDKCISEVDAKTAFSALGNAYILFYYQQ